MSELPRDVVDEVERLTRLARTATDPAEADARRERRAELLAEHGYVCRVREEDDTLVCHPADWLDEDGVVDPDAIDTERAVERALEGTGSAEEWSAVDEHNRAIAAAVREEHGDVHGDNVEALADFLGNHCAKRIEEATRSDLSTFLSEYFPRNAWPDDEQRAVVEESVELAFDAAGAETPPGWTA